MNTNDPHPDPHWPAAWSPAQALGAAPHEASLLHTILDSSTEWILVKDREFRVRYANRALLDGLGLTQVDVIGRLDSDLVPYAEAFRAQDLAALAGHDVHAVSRMRSPPPEGHAGGACPHGHSLTRPADGPATASTLETVATACVCFTHTSTTHATSAGERLSPRTYPHEESTPCGS